MIVGFEPRAEGIAEPESVLTSGYCIPLIADVLQEAKHHLINDLQRTN